MISRLNLMRLIREVIKRLKINVLIKDFIKSRKNKNKTLSLNNKKLHSLFKFIYN